jgi:hypothetical protein
MLLALNAPQVQAGVFTGYEEDSDASRMVFIGGQTEGTIYAHVFSANMKYEFVSGDDRVAVDSDLLSLAAGYRFGDSTSYSIGAGVTFDEKSEQNLTTREILESDGNSGFFQFSAASFGAGKSWELLASYTLEDSFLWSRARVKRLIGGNLSGGGELVWMGNDDADSWGVGGLIEWSSDIGSLGFKVGYKRTTLDEDGSYMGVEAYFPF